MVMSADNSLKIRFHRSVRTENSENMYTSIPTVIVLKALCSHIFALLDRHVMYVCVGPAVGLGEARLSITLSQNPGKGQSWPVYSCWWHMD